MEKRIFTEVLRAARRRKGTSFKELSISVGVTSGCIKSYFDGRVIPRLHIATRLAGALEFSLDGLSFSPPQKSLVSSRVSESRLRIIEHKPDALLLPISPKHAEFGLKLRTRRHELGLTQIKVAKKIEVSKTSIHSLEIGARFSRNGILKKYIEFLDLSVDETELNSLHEEAKRIFNERNGWRTNRPSNRATPPPAKCLYTSPFEHPFFKAIKKKRLEMSLSLSQVAVAIGAHKKALGAMERGWSVIQQPRLERLADFYNLKLEDYDIAEFRWLCAQNMKLVIKKREENRLPEKPKPESSKWDRLLYQDHKGQVSLSRGQDG